MSLVFCEDPFASSGLKVNDQLVANVTRFLIIMHF